MAIARMGSALELFRLVVSGMEWQFTEQRFDESSTRRLQSCAWSVQCGSRSLRHADGVVCGEGFVEFVPQIST